MKRSGFTMIELLITISIIAILAAIGLVSYNIVMKQGRDARRQSDLRAIQSALEQYYHDQGFYPSAKAADDTSGNTVNGLDDILTESASTPFTSNTGWPLPSPTPKPRTYLQSPPKDPTKAASNRYQYEAVGPTPPCDNSDSNKCTSYCLYVQLDNLPSSLPTVPAGCTLPFGYSLIITPP